MYKLLATAPLAPDRAYREQAQIARHARARVCVCVRDARAARNSHIIMWLFINYPNIVCNASGK